MQVDLESLRTVVQRNCHISDARHARDYTMCVYLLKMREFFRWERGFSLQDSLAGDAVGEWLTAREQLWEQLQDVPYDSIALNGALHDPFNTAEINRALTPHGLVYSGGLGHSGRPHFFLGRLYRMQTGDGYTLLIAGEEYARDLAAPPAMALGSTIFVRRESLRRMLWEKIEEWRWRKYDNPMAHALAAYDFDNDVEGALESMTDNELDAVVLHEIGEVMASDALGEEWHELLIELPHSKAEIMVRAVRDHLADCLSTLPRLIDDDRQASLHFYVGNLRAMRREIFPGLVRAYQDWIRDGDSGVLLEVVARGRRHWSAVAKEVLALRRTHRSDSAQRIEAFIEANYL